MKAQPFLAEESDMEVNEETKFETSRARFRKGTAASSLMFLTFAGCVLWWRHGAGGALADQRSIALPGVSIMYGQHLRIKNVYRSVGDDVYLDTCGLNQYTCGGGLGVVATPTSQGRVHDSYNDAVWVLQKVGGGVGPVMAGDPVRIMNVYRSASDAFYLDTCGLNTQTCGGGLGVVATPTSQGRVEDTYHDAEWVLEKSDGGSGPVTAGDPIRIKNVYRSVGDDVYLDTCGLNHYTCGGGLGVVATPTSQGRVHDSYNDAVWTLEEA